MYCHTHTYSQVLNFSHTKKNCTGPQVSVRVSVNLAVTHALFLLSLYFALSGMEVVLCVFSITVVLQFTAPISVNWD